MSDALHLATRKGWFLVERSGAGRWKVGRSAFVGDNVTMLFDDGRDDTLYAALNLGHFGRKIHRSEDRGRSWHECGAPAFARQADDDAKGPSVQQVWALESAGADRPGALWAGTIPGGLFLSTDRGETWRLNEPLWNRPERSEWFGGGYDDPGIHSICVDPRDSRHVTVGVSCGGVWVSRDAGETWRCCADGMYAEYMPPEKRNHGPIQDPHRLVQCAAAPDAMWVQHHNGVFRSTDGSASWREVTAIEPAKFGFAVAVHPHKPDTAWFVPGVKDECRVPVEGRMVVARTRDGGKSFDVLREGLPQEHAYDLVFRHALDVDATGERLAVGSTTGNLWISENGGDRWQLVSAHLPPIYQVQFAA